MSTLLICSGSNVLLPGNDHPIPASIIVEKSSGKIVEVREGLHTHDNLELDFKNAEWIDAGTNVVLPGLVEYVISIVESNL